MSRDIGLANNSTMGGNVYYRGFGAGPVVFLQEKRTCQSW